MFMHDDINTGNVYASVSKKFSQLFNSFSLSLFLRPRSFLFLFFFFLFFFSLFFFTDIEIRCKLVNIEIANAKLMFLQRGVLCSL